MTAAASSEHPTTITAARAGIDNPLAPATLPASPTASPRGSGATLFVVLAAQLMAVIDLTVVNIAAPTVRTDLHASGAGIQLVIAGYVITYAMSLITGARLGDLLGHGRAFLAGLILLTVASLACGWAGTTSELVIFR
ncbi:MAG: hypothetical protein JWM76_626, partial [Pseudonocardiales bacterium]|nr:hypothetical protein [Pseudonocardiales bacterium]